MIAVTADSECRPCIHSEDIVFKTVRPNRLRRRNVIATQPSLVFIDHASEWKIFRSGLNNKENATLVRPIAAVEAVIIVSDRARDADRPPVICVDEHLQIIAPSIVTFERNDQIRMALP